MKLKNKTKKKNLIYEKQNVFLLIKIKIIIDIYMAFFIE